MAHQVQVDHAQFCCSICLDLLSHPVTVPCGHNYCSGCIDGFWSQEDQRGRFSCPQCSQTFNPRPVLKKNNLLAEISGLFKNTKLQGVPPHHYAGHGDVVCDFCTGRKLKAVKTCLQCLVSYCDTHLQPHYQSPAFKKHKLIEASGKLQENICSLHDEVTKLFCRTDQQCICYLCSVEGHKGHDMISAAAERTDKQKELDTSLKNFQQRIHEKEKDVKVFAFIRDGLNNEVSRAEEQRNRGEQEITELRRRHAELEQISHIEDHINFLQRYTFSKTTASTYPVSSNVSHLRYFEDVIMAVAKMRDQLEDIPKDKEEGTMVAETMIRVDGLLSAPEPKTRAEFIMYSCPIVLDPNTANPELSLSKGNRKVIWMDKQITYPPHPDRFTEVCQVLSREGLTGRCYWEVELSGQRVDIAVSYINISRTGCSADECLFGRNDKSWSLMCYKRSFDFRHNGNGTFISGPMSSRVGVYLDHSAGTLSFYSISDTMTLLHRVQTTFTAPLYAGFWLPPLNGSNIELCDLVQPQPY